MNIKVRKLISELAEDYVNFFDVTPHSERPDDNECKCYCVWWCKEDHDVNNIDYLLSPELRRTYAIEKIKSNSIQGYLAYSGDEVVGWCNANTKSDCLKCYCWRRFMETVQIAEVEEVHQVKSIFCFLVAPALRGKGIARLLLERVCQDAKQDGYGVIEAYPQKGFISEAIDFMGPAELFKQSGFDLWYETDDKYVMRKRLK